MNIFRNGVEQYSEYLDEGEYLSEYLLDTGVMNMAVNGLTPVIYRYTVPADTRVFLKRGLLTMEDGAAAFAPGNFGALAGALANGIEISITPSGGSKVILETWTTNRQIRDTFYDFDQTFRTDGIYTGRWTFTRDLNDNGITLTTGDVFDFKIQDNLSTLDYLSFKLKGIKKLIV